MVYLFIIQPKSKYSVSSLQSQVNRQRLHSFRRNISQPVNYIILVNCDIILLFTDIPEVKL